MAEERLVGAGAGVPVGGVELLDALDQLDLERAGGGRRRCAQASSKIASTSTAALRGRLVQPTAKRA